MTGQQRRLSHLTRRKVLTAVIGGTTAATAGCTSRGDNPDNNDTSDGNPASTGEPSANDGISEEDVPDFAVDDAAQPTPILLAAEVVDTPSPLQFLDHFTVELAVGNTGGATISKQSVEVSARLLDDDEPSGSTVNEPDPVSVSLPEIDSGDWITTETELRVTAGGDWTIATDIAEHPGFEPAIEVRPRRLTAGDSVTSENGHFEIAALEPAFERALHYETEEGGVGLFSKEATGLLDTDDGYILVLHRFRVENTSNERSLGFGQVYSDNRFTDARLRGVPTDVLTSDDTGDDLSTLVVDEYGTVFQDNDIPPGEAVNLLAVQEVSEEDITDASVTLSFWGGTEDVLFDTVEEAPALPKFELVDASITSAGDEPVIEATVKNVGDSTGVFRGAGQFYHSRPTAPDWVYLPEGMEATIKSGEQATVSTVASRGDDRFRVVPFETELTL